MRIIWPQRGMEWFGFSLSLVVILMLILVGVRHHLARSRAGKEILDCRNKWGWWIFIAMSTAYFILLVADYLSTDGLKVGRTYYSGSLALIVHSLIWGLAQGIYENGILCHVWKLIPLEKIQSFEPKYPGVWDGVTLHHVDSKGQIKKAYLSVPSKIFPRLVESLKARGIPEKPTSA